MYQIDFSKPVHVYFIGIGGISMSALAEILISRDFTVSGSDIKESDLTRLLVSKGCRINIGQVAENITTDIDVAVYTAAVHKDNPEMAACIAGDIPTLSRAELLGQLMLNYKTAIGVSGTHGKTSTTSMLSEILLKTDEDPTILVGGMLPTIGGNLRIGSTNVMLTEACEYTNSFLSFCPTMNIILNVEADHLDFFKDLEDIRNSFKKYTELLPDDGFLIINSAIDNYPFFYEDSSCSVVTFGLDNEASDYSATDITPTEDGGSEYTLLYMNKPVTRVRLRVPGIHNVLNSLAAIAAASTLRIDLDQIIAGLNAYTGVDRRFQIKGKFNGVTVVDDYAHHPSEIAATLNAAKSFPHKKLWVIFQPHTYTRTLALLNDFADVLSTAENVVLAKIYPAREKDIYGVSSENVKELIDRTGTPCYCFNDFESIENFIKDTCTDGDLVITMGAGDIYQVGEHLLS